jgi:hypothetical protein
MKKMGKPGRGDNTRVRYSLEAVWITAKGLSNSIYVK